MKKRAAVLLLAVLLAASSGTTAMAAAAPPPGTSSPFSDLPADHWSFPYVYELYTQGVVGGYPDGTFQRQSRITWGETFKLILGAIGAEDIPQREPGQHWAYPYIQPAFDNRLVYTFDEEYLNECPTRLDVARMSARALDLTDISGESPYADCEDGYVVELYEKGIMEGTMESDGIRRFYPDQYITREEMAAVVWRMMNVDFSDGMFYFRSYWLDRLEDLPLMAYTDDQFTADEKGRLAYSGGYYTRGIDVSGHKGEIDWEAVAADGIDFAIIRAGNRFYGKNGSGALVEDSWFDRNMEGAIAAGMDVGAYLFSNAITVEEALEEADLLLSKLEPYRQYVTYPVVCDWEYLGGNDSRAYGVDAKTITQCVDAFCRRVEEAGYQPMFYFNAYCGYVKLDLSQLSQYPFWYAEYADAPDFLYNFQMWQYSDKGQVAGISSNVDMDLCFIPFPGATRRPGVTPEAPPEPMPEETGQLPEETSYLPEEPLIP